MPLRGNDGTGEEAVYEIYPFKDDEYELQVLDVPAGRTGSLRIYRDVRASRRRQRAARGSGGDGGWKLGIELAAGYHSSYQLSRYEEFIEVERSGADYEGCLSLRAQGTRAWGCLIGLTQHDAGDDASIVWFFVEPRVRLIGGVSSDPLELGVMIRLGFGAADQGGSDLRPPRPGDSRILFSLLDQFTRQGSERLDRCPEGIHPGQ